MTGLTVRAVGLCAPPPGSQGEWFDVGTELGRRGYKYLPRAAQLVLAAGRRALAALPADVLAAVPAVDRSIWVGTSQSAPSVHTGMDEVVRTDGAELLSPLTSPYFSINLLVGRLSTEFEAHGGATTFTTPTTAGLDALAACARSRRRSGLALVAAVEVPPPDGEPGSGESPESGAVVLALTPGGDGPRLTARGGSWTPATLGSDLRALVAELSVGVPDPAVELLLADEAKQHLTGELPGAVVDSAGPGSSRPLAALAAAVTGDAKDSATARILVVAGPDGRLGAALVHRSPVTEESW